MFEMRTIVPLTATRRPNCEERRLPSDVTRCVSSIRARTAGKLGASTTVQLLSPSCDCAVDSCQGFGSVYLTLMIRILAVNCLLPADPGSVSSSAKPKVESVGYRYLGNVRYLQCSDPWHFRTYRSGSLDLYHWLTVPDPDPALFVSGLQNANRKFYFKFFLYFFAYYCWVRVHLHHSWFFLHRWKAINKSKTVEIKGCLLTVFVWWWKDSDRDPQTIRIRIRTYLWLPDPGDPKTH